MFQSKDSALHARQLEAQSVVVAVNAVAGTADQSNVSVDNSTITATVITLDVKEDVKKCLRALVHNRTTGAIVAIAAAPSLAVDQKISVTINGTGLTDLAVEMIYIVAE